MKSNAQVLLFGRDALLLQTRKLILGTYFEVEVAGRLTHAAQLIAERNFDLIVFCSSLSNDECERAAEIAAAQNPRPKILTLSTTGRNLPDPVACYELIEDIGPLALARKAATMLGLQMKLNGRGVQQLRLTETEKLQPH